MVDDPDDERVITFSRVQIEEGRDTLYPVWGILETFGSAYSNLLILSQEETVDLLAQINDKFQMFDLTEADVERERIIETAMSAAEAADRATRTLRDCGDSGD